MARAARKTVRATYRDLPTAHVCVASSGRAGAIEWNIVDQHVAPPEHARAHFSEKLVMLPHSYQVGGARSDAAGL